METRTKDQKTTPRKGKQKFAFDSPPEAPVFTPTLEEFKNPLNYINQIRIIGEKTGICKIIPPEGWKSPFVLDKDKLKFTPRIQRINELEARTRIKLNFIDQLTKFFAIKGKTFQIPLVEKNSLDLYTLHRLVKENGGVEEVSKEKKWSDIAAQMGFTGKTSFTMLKHHYEHLIHPFLLSQTSDEHRETNVCSRSVDKSMSNHNINNIIGNTSDGNHLLAFDNDDSNSNFSSKPIAFRELKSLRFLGPGPKMAVCEESDMMQEMKSRTRGKKILYEFDPLAKYMCKSCSTGDIEESLVTCISCEDRYHSSCLIPALTDVPERWRCPKCVAAEVYKPLEDFGFAQAEKEYTLNEFRNMAHEFKKGYFKTEPTLVPTNKVEEEFWRVVSSIDEAVTVEYGADLHVIDHGSAFPRKNQPYVSGIDKAIYDEYANSPWNLNNLPVLNSSVLRHISADISGMKIPWMYAGMCFATFCWHNEDHWSYSINYLHLGEPKTWYGVSGSNAEKFERAMKAAAPELFAAQPDLLHHLVTIMNPNDLMVAGVPVFRTDQKEGEFVVTFPRAYHAGFNQGFNFAEACNFAPYDWLQIGRECISHYSSLKRPCVFSHDELVCNMALIFDELDKDIAEATMKDMIAMVNAETTKWNRAVNYGISSVIDFNYESLPDDERQCCECNTTVFLSAVVCPCNKSKLVCLEHIHKLCECKPCNYIVKCQFRINFLREIIEIMKSKLFRFGDWKNRVENALSNKSKTKITLRALTELLIEAKDKEFPHTDLIDLLEFQVRKCIDCSALARVIVNSGLGKKNIQNRLTVDDISMFYNEIKNLPCTIMETTALKHILDEALKFQRIAYKILTKKAVPKSRVLSCIKMGKTLDLDLMELPLLEKKLSELEWLAAVEDIIHQQKPAELDEIQNLLDSSISSANNNVQIKREELVKHFENLKGYKEKSNCLAIRNEDIEEMEYIVSESEQFKINLPNKEILMVKVNEGKNMMDTLEKILTGEVVYYLSELDHIIVKAKSLNVSIKYITELEEALLDVRKWESAAKKLFLKRNSSISLMEALWPRRFKHRSLHFQRALINNNTNLESLIDDKGHNFTKSDFRYSYREHMLSLNKLRIENLEALAQDDPTIKKRCICGDILAGHSIVCVLCKTSFHISCFKIDETVMNAQIFGFTTKSLCSYCTRTKRPPIEAIETLFSSSKQLKIKIPECFALFYSINKLKKWQKEAKALLSSKEMIAGLNVILGNMIATSKTLESWSSCKKQLFQNYALKTNQNKRQKLMSNINLKAQVTFSTVGLVDLLQLMTIGDSFEASSPESEQMWILYDTRQMRFHQEIKNTIEPSQPTPSPTIKLNIPKPSLASVLKAQKPKTTKLKKIIKKNGIKNVTKSTCVTTKRKKRNIKTLTKQLIPNTLQTGIWEEHEPGDICAAAANCLKPPDLSVNWVQCDGQCGQWFHMKCVDLDNGDVKEEDEFKCLQCTQLLEEEMMPPFKPIKLPCSSQLI